MMVCLLLVIRIIFYVIMVNSNMIWLYIVKPYILKHLYLI